MSGGDESKKEVYLEADKEIPGQHYVCLSFISPNKVLAKKEYYYFSEFMKDYQIQYRIKATESFVMQQAVKLQDAMSRVQDALENVMLKSEVSMEDVSGVLATVKDVRVSVTANATTDLEAHVKENLSEFKVSDIEDAYETFVFKHKKRLEDDFFASNEFRTTVQGLKVRGVYDTYNEAVARAKTLQKLDPSFNVYVGQVGFWLPWDPEPSDVADQEYADDQLNTLMKKYRENEQKRDELYAEEKNQKLKGAKVRGITGPSVLGASGPTSDVPSNTMFEGEDLAIARKRENKQ